MIVLDQNQFTLPTFSKSVIVIVGAFGSGKSEVAVNLAAYLARTTDEPVTIADLDVVNPYFRSRQALDELIALGVKSLVPHGEQVHADLPIIIPEIKGAIQQRIGKLILDVGGDDLGGRVINSLIDAFKDGTYELLLTHNRNRPFTSDVAGSVKMLRDIEFACGLRFSGLISNSHMIDETTVDTVLEGIELAEEIAKEVNLPICFVSAVTEVLKLMPAGKIKHPVLPIDRSLLKPWERGKKMNRE